MKNTIHIANFGLIHKYCAMVLCQQHFFMLGSGTCSSVSDIYNECESKWPDESDLSPPEQHSPLPVSAEPEADRVRV